MFVRRAIQETDYDLLANFFERDLGGRQYFKWKNFYDPLDNASINNRAICFEKNQDCLGIIYSKRYDFRVNNYALKVNLLSDFGIDKHCKSRNLVIDLFRKSYIDDADLVMCFSDKRKSRIYQKIFSRYFTPNTQIIRYIEVTCQPQTIQPYEHVHAHEIPDEVWRNHFGRKRDKKTSDYLSQHPLYLEIHYLHHENKYLTIGITETHAEIIDVSDTTDFHFKWSLGVAARFRKNCRILLHEQRAPQILQNIPVLHEKSVCMLLGYMTDIQPFDQDHVWIGRVDRR